MSEWANRLFFFNKLLIRSFFLKKQEIRSENWWANSEPWFFLMYKLKLEFFHLNFKSDHNFSEANCKHKELINVELIKMSQCESVMESIHHKFN